MALGLVLALVGLFVYLRVSSELSGAIDDGLRARASDLVALVRSTPERPRLAGALFEGEEGFSQVLRPDGRVVASTLPRDAGAAIEPALLADAVRAPVLVDGRRVSGVDGDVRVLARPADAPGGRLVVVAGASTEDRREALSGVAGAFLVGAPLALLLASGLAYLLATRSFAPVEAMRRRAEGITFARSGERLPLPRAQDELRRLGETLNTMLDRLEAALERERVFVADASHELRTPLAILRAELELAERPGRAPEELEAAIRSAGEEVDRLSRLAEDLLVIARSDQGRLPVAREQVDLAALLERVRARFARAADQRGRALVVDAQDGAGAELDVLRMEQALGNLVDNALRHGAGTVRLVARREDGSAVLEIGDEGPGFPDGFERAAFDRFTRGEGGRTGGGAGLGLAIARAIAVAHDGRLEVVASGASGTALRIAVPATAG